MRLYWWANALTVGRLAAVPLVVWLLIKSQGAHDRLPLALLVLMQASDILDGFLARRARRAIGIGNRFGEILDPIADKLYIGSTYITLSFTRHFPEWLMLTVVSRDLLLLFAWLLRLLITNIRTVRPNALGKTADGLQAFLIFAFLLGVPGRILNAWYALTVAFTVASGLAYLMRDIKGARSLEAGDLS